MSDQSKIALNLQRFRIAVNAHDRENPNHNSYGIGLSQFDMDRLGFEEGEELWPGIRVECDGGQSAKFRVLCDGDHDEAPGRITEEQETVRAVATEKVPA